MSGNQDTSASQPNEPGQPSAEATAVNMPGETSGITSRSSSAGKTLTPAIENYSIFQRHMIYDPLMIIFTILIFAGGAIGYFTKNSAPSLISGTIFAFLLAAGTFIEGTRRNQYPLMVVLLALGIMMTYRYLKNMVFMPSGLVAVATFFMLARHMYIFYLRRRTASL